MVGNIGLTGLVGVVLLIAGLGIVAVENPVIAIGFSLVLVGIGLVAKGLITNIMRSFGMY